MYLSTLFLSEIDNGAQYAIESCNAEFLGRFTDLPDFPASASSAAPSEEVSQDPDLQDELAALWDVFKEFKEEISVDLPVVQAMDAVRAARRQAAG